MWGPLRFLYVGTEDTARDARWYVEKAGARKLWHVRAFGAEVAALDVGGGPLLLLADHRAPGTVLLIYGVKDLKAAVAAMAQAGWQPEGPRSRCPTARAGCSATPRATSSACCRRRGRGRWRPPTPTPATPMR